MKGNLDGYISGWIEKIPVPDESMDEWMDEWMDGWMDGWIGRFMNR